MHGKHPPPPKLPGFEHIKRSWNTVHEKHMARIKPGEYYVTKHDEGILTVLGSCISACIRDRVYGIGGMNHFMLPTAPGSKLSEWGAADNSAATRYGNYAMERLINEIMKNTKNDFKRENLEVKIFGGCSVMQSMPDIGNRNILFIRDYLKMEGLKVTVEDLGDIYPRTVVYFPFSGLVRVKRLQTLHIKSIVDQENKYIKSVSDKPVVGDIELF